MDRQQHGHPIVRTNQRIRQQVRSIIRNFFSEAQGRLPVPDWTTCISVMDDFKMDPEIHKDYYECSWGNVNVRVKNVGSFQMPLPEEKYGVLEEGDHYSSYYLSIDVEADQVPEEVVKYFSRRSEMGAASNALLRGADEALRETTVEKALLRLPEIKRFIPHETK